MDLPEEIITELLLPRLPATSLLRFRCVSKSWGSLIGSKRFIKKHHENWIKNSSFPQRRAIIQGSDIEWPKQCSLLSVLNAPRDAIMLPTPFSRLAPPTNTKLVEFRIMGCYNGLLCLLEQPARRIHLWNPSTRICKKLPEIPDCGGIHTLGFGWVESSDEYKVFLVHNDGAYKVYSSKAKSWKTIGLRTDLLRVLGTGVFAGGKLHWSHFRPCEQYILFFDFKSEVFGSIDLPFAPDIRDKFGLVCVLGGSLCVLRRHDDYERGLTHVWVMKEESWEKAVALDHLLELLQSPSPLVVGLNGEVLLNIGSHLLVYDARDNVFHVLKYTAYCHVYVESLVSPEDL